MKTKDKRQKKRKQINKTEKRKPGKIGGKMKTPINLIEEHLDAIWAGPIKKPPRASPSTACN
jgi:hypothetical protein